MKSIEKYANAISVKARWLRLRSIYIRRPDPRWKCGSVKNEKPEQRKQQQLQQEQQHDNKKNKKKKKKEEEEEKKSI